MLIPMFGGKLCHMSLLNSSRRPFTSKEESFTIGKEALFYRIVFESGRDRVIVQDGMIEKAGLVP